MSAVLSRLDDLNSTASVLPDLLPLFFPSSRDDLFRHLAQHATGLIDTASPNFIAILNSTAQIRDSLTAYTVARPPQRAAVLTSVVSGCEDAYAEILDSLEVNQTFLLGVPLAFLHVAALREKLIQGSAVVTADSQRNISVWLATISQLKIERWVQTTLLQDICHALLTDTLQQRHLLNLQQEDCSDPDWMDSQLEQKQQQHFNRLHFRMLTILSNLFVLHRLLPGSETLPPYSGNFPTAVTFHPFESPPNPVKKNNTLSINNFRLALTMSGASPGMPAPLRSGLMLIKGSPVFGLTHRKKDFAGSGAVSHWKDVLGYDVPLPVTPSPIAKNVTKVTTTPGKVTRRWSTVTTTTEPTTTVSLNPYGPWVVPAFVTRTPAAPVTTALASATSPTVRRAVVRHGQFNLPDTIAITADTRRQRDRILEKEIKPIWANVFGRDVAAGFGISVTGDSPFDPATTPEGQQLRRVAYTVDGTSTVDLNFDVAAGAFHRLALLAGLPNLWGVLDINGTWVPNTRRPVYTAPPSTSTAEPYYRRPTTTEAATTPETVGGTSERPLVSLEDVVVVRADTRQQRDRVLEEEIRPVWQGVLGADVGDFELQVQNDTPYTPARDKKGVVLRQVTYRLNGIAASTSAFEQLDGNALLDSFHQQAKASGLQHLYAIGARGFKCCRLV
ncbi:uncharacterized protein LOC129592383 [Paramacrobiotus metropolitanus]|uniref:uncharacterized protein LOC129592383 n=1 Tax=Paramacrobiotus metropolitanus TaxID=2943436 RepID=UPI002445AF09|nr:uncharacterized protein LOC129592383 [Paramacrobiotus metropolitanus]